MATTGAAHLALASDALSTPPELLPLFAERAALLPGTFFVSGHSENHADVLDVASWKPSVFVEQVSSLNTPARDPPRPRAPCTPPARPPTTPAPAP